MGPGSLQRVKLLTHDQQLAGLPPSNVMQYSISRLLMNFRMFPLDLSFRFPLCFSRFRFFFFPLVL